MRFAVSLAILGFLLLNNTGCAASNKNQPWVKVRPLGQEYTAPLPSSDLTESQKQVVESEYEHQENLTLNDAIQRVLSSNPTLQMAAIDVRRSEASEIQAGTLSNPELGFEMEEFGGSGERKGFDSAVTTLRVSQDISLAGRNTKAKRAASEQTRLNAWEHERRRLALVVEATQGFIQVLAAQERLNVMQDNYALAQEVSRVVGERVDAGKVSPLEKQNADVALAEALIELRRGEYALTQSKRNLCGLWGQGHVSFDKAIGALDEIVSVPEFHDLTAKLIQNPSKEIIGAERVQLESALSAAKAEGIPDLTVSAGIQRFEDNGDVAPVVGLAMALPIFDRNQGEIKDIQYQLVQLGLKERNVDVQLGLKLRQAHSRMEKAYGIVGTLKNAILPNVESVFQSAEEGYMQGKFTYLELLGAQRRLQDARADYVDALTDYQLAKSELERLIGESLVSINKNTDN